MTALLEKPIHRTASHAETPVPAPAPATVVPTPKRRILTGSQRLAGMMWSRAPFTLTVAAAMLVAAVATGSVWTDVTAQPWFESIGYGVPAWQAGHWWTPVTGAFFALTPWFYLPMTGSFLLLVGFTEARIGTRRTVLVTVGGHLAALAAGMAILTVFADSNWAWAATIHDKLDAGFSAGALAAITVTSAVLRDPWRVRVRVALSLYVVVAFAFVGNLADLLHLLAVAFALPLGPRLTRGARPTVRRRLTRREWRLLAAAGLALIAVSDLVLVLTSSVGPLGGDDSGLTLTRVVVNLVLAGLLANGLRKGRLIPWWIAVTVAGASTVMGWALVVGALGGTPVPDDGLPLAIAAQIIWTALFVLLVLGRRAFRAPSRGVLRSKLQHRTNRRAALEILKTGGGGNLSWMSTWRENLYFVTPDGSSVVAYQVHRGVAIAIGDPIGPVESRESTVSEFIADSERLGLVPAFFSAGTGTTACAVYNGYRQLQIAEDTILDLPGLEFRGKSWQDIRTAINRAAKEQISFRLTTLADEPPTVIAQVRAVSEKWFADKGLPELGFTLGGVDEALDPHVRVGLAEDPSGTVHGVVSWLPVYAGNGRIDGWTLDVMRRRDDGFRPVIDFLIAQSALAFQGQGYRFMSLSGAPLAHSGSDQPGTGLPKLLDSLGEVMEPLYGFRSLHAFKAKFAPRYESLHLIYRDEADLPRIGLALTKAYLPGASMRDLLRLARTAH